MAPLGECPQQTVTIALATNELLQLQQLDLGIQNDRDQDGFADLESPCFSDFELASWESGEFSATEDWDSGEEYSSTETDSEEEGCMNSHLKERVCLGGGKGRECARCCDAD